MTARYLFGYYQKGASFFSELDGMFAAALFDENSNKLFLLDRAGIKPLRYLIHNEELIRF